MRTGNSGSRAAAFVAAVAKDCVLLTHPQSMGGFSILGCQNIRWSCSASLILASDRASGCHAHCLQLELKRQGFQAVIWLHGSLRKDWKVLVHVLSKNNHWLGDVRLGM